MFYLLLDSKCFNLNIHKEILTLIKTTFDSLVDINTIYKFFSEDLKDILSSKEPTYLLLNGVLQTYFRKLMLCFYKQDFYDYTKLFKSLVRNLN